MLGMARAVAHQQGWQAQRLGREVDKRGSRRGGRMGGEKEEGGEGGPIKRGRGDRGSEVRAQVGKQKGMEAERRAQQCFC